MASGGRFSFMKALERAHPDIDKKIKEKASGGSAFQRLGLATMIGAHTPSKVNALKIGKTSGPGATFSKVVEEAKKKAEDPKHGATFGLAKAVISKDKDKARASGKSLVAAAATKKKDKKPVSPGTAAINV